MPKNDSPKLNNKFIFEIRYKPNSKVLDFRGTWAEKISAHMKLSEWRIVENRVDVLDQDAKNHGFVGFRNSGFVSNDVPTANYFPDQAVKFFKYVLELDGFDSPLFVTRIGVRSKFYRAFEGNFDDLLKRYSTRYLVLTDQAKEIMRADLVDIGGPVNFSDSHGNFNTMSGPMNDEQAKKFLDGKNDLPKVGLYFEIDYWQKPEKQVENANILQLISIFSKESWNKYEGICKLVTED
jgi:hypothetical protein